jgi:hypothetical protein
LRAKRRGATTSAHVERNSFRSRAKQNGMNSVPRKSPTPEWLEESPRGIGCSGANERTIPEGTPGRSVKPRSGMELKAEAGTRIALQQRLAESLRARTADRLGQPRSASGSAGRMEDGVDARIGRHAMGETEVTKKRVVLWPNFVEEQAPRIGRRSRVGTQRRLFRQAVA